MLCGALCRRADQGPLLTLGGHARWVWRVRHNPVHDALVLTSAGDFLSGPHEHSWSQTLQCMLCHRFLSICMQCKVLLPFTTY
jgi:hypothetical protein